MQRRGHIVVTDSGLGGLSICAGLERALRGTAFAPEGRLTYVNAWPFEGRGYNDLPDVTSRARVFDRALARMAAMEPDAILIACNTLSILYPHTAFSRRPPLPVRGVIDAGVSLFASELSADPASTIVLVGTKITIESGAHREALLARGVDGARVAAAACHGLAAAIERDVQGPGTEHLLAECAARAAEAAPPGGTLFVGLCCTHYGYVTGRIASAVAGASHRPVRPLDPNRELVRSLLADEAVMGTALDSAPRPAGADGAGPQPGVPVRLVSKVALDDAARQAIARLVEPVSPPAAAALLSYSHVPDLF